MMVALRRLDRIGTTPIAFFTVREMADLCGYKHRSSMQRILGELNLLEKISANRYVVPLSRLENIGWLFDSVMSAIALRAQASARGTEEPQEE